MGKCLKHFDINDDGEKELIVGGYKISSGSGLSYGRSEVKLGTFSQDFDTLNIRTFATVRYREGDNYRSVSLYDLETAYNEENELFISIAYRDSLGTRIDLVSPSNLEIEQTRSLPSVPIKCMSVYSSVIENESDFLICINEDGWLYSIYTDELQIADIIEDFTANVIDLKIGNFDDDEDMEMAVLTRDAFIMYDLGRLSVPSSSQPPWTPETYAITAAYPNPFNNRARIEYTVPQPGRITLTLHDLTGRLVGRLSEGWQTAGTYDIILNADDLPGGAYLIRLEGARGDAVRVVQVVK